MNSQSNPFQLKKHSEDVLEIIVDELITPEHKALAVLQAMTLKFQFVILSLNPTAALHPALETIIPDLQLLGSLLIVATEPAQTPFTLHGIRIFSDIHAAITRIRNIRLIETIVKRIVSLPSFKSSTDKILRMLCNPEVTFEQIEQVCSTDYEALMPVLAEERAKNLRLHPPKRAPIPIEISESDEAENGTEEQNQDLFSSAIVCALLKEELDQFIIAGPEAIGM